MIFGGVPISKTDSWACLLKTTLVRPQPVDLPGMGQPAGSGRRDIQVLPPLLADEGSSQEKTAITLLTNCLHMRVMNVCFDLKLFKICSNFGMGPWIFILHFFIKANVLYILKNFQFSFIYTCFELLSGVSRVVWGTHLPLLTPWANAAPFAVNAELVAPFAVNGATARVLFPCICPLKLSTTRGRSSRWAAGLQPSLKNVRQKIPPNGQTRLKFGFSYEISQHNHFRYSDTILAQRFLRMQQNQCFALFQRRRLWDDVFSTLADEFGDFRAVFGTALKERNWTVGYKKHGGISA